MSARKLLVAATVASLPIVATGVAQAQPVQGVYIGLGGLYNYHQTTDVTPRPALANGFAANGIPTRGKFTYQDGFGGVLSLGYGFGNGFRVEIEGNYRENGLAGAHGFNTRTRFTGLEGQERNYGGMANLLYDFSPYQFGLVGIDYVQPYLGIGVGGVQTEFNNLRSSPSAAVSRFQLTSDPRNNTDFNFAYQGIAGLNFPLTAYGITGLSLTTEYRFLGTTSPSTGFELVNRGNGALVARGRAETDNYNHSVLVGLRYAFNQPVPPAPYVPPIAAPLPPGIARTYLVFFDWNRADLTGRARQIIGEAAQNSRTAGVTRIEVAGHADRSGTPAYNLRLSQRRAEVVAAQLVRDGVGRGQIVTQAFGESRPLVPTADGVREPQNRRVEIVLR